jgi:hypothetical protein
MSIDVMKALLRTYGACGITVATAPERSFRVRQGVRATVMPSEKNESRSSTALDRSLGFAVDSSEYFWADLRVDGTWIVPIAGGETSYCVLMSCTNRHKAVGEE